MKTNELQIVSINQAKQLKSLGFNWEVDRYYALVTDHHNQWRAGVLYKNSCVNNVPEVASAPSIALALKWVRDAKGIYNSVNTEVMIMELTTGTVYLPYIVKRGVTQHYNNRTFSKYEDAESTLLDELLNL